MMNEQKLKDLAAEFAKGIKTEDDLNQFTRLLTKLTVLKRLSMPNLPNISDMKRMLVRTVQMLVTVIPVRPC